MWFFGRRRREVRPPPAPLDRLPRGKLPPGEGPGCCGRAVVADGRAQRLDERLAGGRVVRAAQRNSRIALPAGVARRARGARAVLVAALYGEPGASRRRRDELLRQSAARKRRYPAASAAALRRQVDRSLRPSDGDWPGLRRGGPAAAAGPAAARVGPDRSRSAFRRAGRSSPRIGHVRCAAGARKSRRC